jgi:hypothetical protein
MAVGSTQPLREMSTRNLPEGNERPELMTNNLAAILADCLENVGASTSQPYGPPQPVFTETCLGVPI